MSLTPKQEKFCQNVVSGMSAKDSYINAYNTKSSDRIAINEGSKLMLREDIQQRIDDLTKPLQKAVQQQALTEREKKKQIIWERIDACILSGDDVAVARYMDILNKMDAEYININKNIEEKKTNIEALDSETLKLLSKSS